MSEPDDYFEIGWHSFYEARRIFELLQQYAIRFEFETSDMAIRALSPMAANYGGTFGHGAQAHIFIHRGDEKKFRQHQLEITRLPGEKMPPG